ncbi:MAG: hypothetical protein MJ146_04765 [Clostridia bacterium]|nr:hypothetical protein [Clostridia bacterium]
MKEKDYNWFLDNYENLYEKYGSKFIAIKDEKILGVYDSFFDAVKKNNSIKDFIVQRLDKDKSAYTKSTR